MLGGYPELSVSDSEHKGFTELSRMCGRNKKPKSFLGEPLGLNVRNNGALQVGCVCVHVTEGTLTQI